MEVFKKLTKSIATNVKETVKEEASKTAEEIKGEFLEATGDILPIIGVILASAVLISIIKRPAPVVVKVVFKQG